MTELGPEINGAAGRTPVEGLAAPGAPMRLGDALVASGVLTPEQLKRALAEQRGSGQRLGELLIEQGLVTGQALVQALARLHGVPGVRLRHGLIDPGLLGMIGEAEAERLRALPLFLVRGTLTVALADPTSLPTIDRIQELTKCRVRPVLALESDILEYVRKYSGGNVDVDAFLTSLSESDVEVIERESVEDQSTTDLETMVDGSPIVNLVNVALLSAVRDGASDIHIEPSRTGTRIRYRCDGVLRDLMRPPPGMHSAIVSRVKVIGKMDIAEKRLPQEGRVRIVAEGRDIDLRVSSMPTLLGEKLVVRVLDKGNLRVKLEELGIGEQPLASFRRVLGLPHGLVLVTGPTGSGKTTTLYSALDVLRTPEVNIVTVEDPVEYQLELINQIQVNDQLGFSFARALRSILRQDPDVIMVGEIRDEETARVAVQAALTGHTVLATLHTNDAPSTVARLRDMGIEPYLLASALNGVVAQRLARTLCGRCTTGYHPSAEVLEDAGLMGRRGLALKKGEGCKACHGSGFRGRLGVYEVMEVNGEIRRLIYEDAPTHAIRKAHRDNGGASLRDAGVDLALSGRTSLEEVLRVTRSDELGGEPTGESAVESATQAQDTSDKRRAAA
ncbi:MAG: ATPase, T2SS/T4P/T4SS family [Planctomycetota bacterium]